MAFINHPRKEFTYDLAFRSASDSRMDTVLQLDDKEKLIQSTRLVIRSAFSRNGSYLAVSLQGGDVQIYRMKEHCSALHCWTIATRCTDIRSLCITDDAWMLLVLNEDKFTVFCRDRDSCWKEESIEGGCLSGMSSMIKTSSLMERVPVDRQMVKFKLIDASRNIEYWFLQRPKLFVGKYWVMERV